MLTRNLLSIPRANSQAFRFERPDFSEIESLFRDAPEFTLHQAWRETLAPDFAPTRVRVMASETDLWMWADLTDDSPRNAATAPNQNTWELGDCFEIFLASSTYGSYYEMHVTPENQTLQLQAESRFETQKIENGPMRCATWLTSGGWQILAALPLELLEDRTSGWISFGRYDYQSGRREPVLSSSSPHREPNFHRRHEWTLFELQLELRTTNRNAEFLISPELIMNQRPNILLITSDQHHWTALGAINDKIKTPNLDRLCAQGTRFNRAYCPNPTCTPTRASIITGQYPSTHGAWTLGTKLPEDAATVGDVFRDNGYQTFLIGKAHFQPTKSAPDQTSVECLPILRDLDYWRTFNDTQTPWYGFDHVELARNHADEALVGQHYAIWLEEQGVENWRDYFQDAETFQPKREGAWDLPAKHHYTTWTASRTIASIEAATASGTPFFGWASFHDPHPPYVVPNPWAQMYDPADMEPGTLLENEMELLPEHFRLTQEAKPDFSAYNETGQGNHGFHSHLTDDEKGRRNMAIYYGMVSFMDEQIGRILDALEEQGIAENTLVVFTTDHGHFLGQHGLWFKGAFHYEDVLRLPFIARWPGHIAAGAQSNALQSLVDLAPTFLAACDLPIPGAMQGVNQLAVWKGEQTSARDEVIVEFRHQPTRVHLRTLVTTRYKMTIYRDQIYGELFDLRDDPDERCNLWVAVAASVVKAEMFEKLAYAEMRREPTALERIAGA